MTRPDIREQRPTQPSHRAIAQAVRAAWEPSPRDVEIVRLRDDEGLTVRAIAARVGLSRSRVSYLYQRYKIRMDERAQREHEEGGAMNDDCGRRRVAKEELLENAQPG